MNKELIQNQAYNRMSRIEEMYSDHVPPYAQAYWRLNYLVAEGIRAYVGSYGLLPIHLGDANEGRNELGLGPLSQFERDVIQFLDQHIEHVERNFHNRNYVQAPRV